MSYQASKPVVFDISKNKNYDPIHPITLYNAVTQKQITIEIESDTGTDNTGVKGEYAKALGLNLNAGIKTGGVDSQGERLSLSMHTLYVKIGNLKPVLAQINFGIPYNLLGRNILNNYKTTYYWNRVIYQQQQLASTTSKAALAEVYYSSSSRGYRNRI